jgi:hypothetical protein
MIVVATLSTFLPGFRSLGVLPPAGIPIQYHPAAVSIISMAPEQFAPFSNAKLLSRLLCCKHVLNVFNHIQPLFSAFLGADPLFSTRSSLFSPKQGVGV